MDDLKHAKNDPLPRRRARVSPLELAETLYKIPTLLTTYTRCGKPNCRCTRGELHGPYHALHWREGPVRRRVYVKAGEVAAVRAAIARRRACRAATQAVLADGLALLRRLDALQQAIEVDLRAERGEQ